MKEPIIQYLSPPQGVLPIDSRGEGGSSYFLEVEIGDRDFLGQEQSDKNVWYFLEVFRCRFRYPLRK